MGRKIPGRKHRGVRDILQQNAKKELKLVGKINAPPVNPDDQAVPKSLARVMELKQKIKDGVIPLKRKRVKKSKPALVSSEIKNSVKIKRPGRPEKPVPVFQQYPGETSKKFMGRVHGMVQEFLKVNEFEQKYQVDIQRNEITGEVEGISKKPKDEIDELMKKSKTTKKKGKAKSETDEATEKLTKSQKRREKLKAKKLKKDEASKPMDFDVFKDEVKFGEVADAPPVFTKFPRGISTDCEKNTGNSKQLSSGTQTLTTGKRKNLSLSVRHMLEEQRKLAVEAYKLLKLQKETHTKT